MRVDHQVAEWVRIARQVGQELVRAVESGLHVHLVADLETRHLRVGLGQLERVRHVRIGVGVRGRIVVDYAVTVRGGQASNERAVHGHVGLVAWRELNARTVLAHVVCAIVNVQVDAVHAIQRRLARVRQIGEQLDLETVLCAETLRLTQRHRVSVLVLARIELVTRLELIYLLLRNVKN